MAFLNWVRNELTRRVRKGRDIIFSNFPDCAGTSFHTKYEEQVTRIAVVLHVLFQVLTHKIRNTVCAHIPEIISLEVLQGSKVLLDFITLQTEMFLEVLVDGRESECVHTLIIPTAKSDT